MVINFFATLRQIVGQKTIEMDYQDGMTVRQLVDHVVHIYPGLRHELLDENGNLYRHVHVFINGRDAPYLEEAMQTSLRPEDQVNIFPAVGGG